MIRNVLGNRRLLMAMLTMAVLVVAIVVVGIIVPQQAHALDVSGEASNGNSSSGGNKVYIGDVTRNPDGVVNNNPVFKIPYDPLHGIDGMKNLWHEDHQNTFSDIFQAHWYRPPNPRPQVTRSVCAFWTVQTNRIDGYSRIVHKDTGVKIEGTDYGEKQIKWWTECDDFPSCGDDNKGDPWAWWHRSRDIGANLGGIPNSGFNEGYVFTNTERRNVAGWIGPNRAEGIKYTYGGKTYAMPGDADALVAAVPQPFIETQYIGYPDYGSQNGARINANLTAVMLNDDALQITAADIARVEQLVNQGTPCRIEKYARYKLTAQIFDGREILMIPLDQQLIDTDAADMKVEYQLPDRPPIEEPRIERDPPIVPTFGAAIQAKTGGPKSTDKWRSLPNGHEGSWICDGRRMGVRSAATQKGKAHNVKIVKDNYFIKFLRSTADGGDGGAEGIRGNSSGDCTLYPWWYLETPAEGPDAIAASHRVRFRAWLIKTYWIDVYEALPNGEKGKFLFTKKDPSRNPNPEYIYYPSKTGWNERYPMASAFLNVGLEILTR